MEQKPDSKTKQASLAEDLSDAGAGDDNELLDQAKSLLNTEIKLIECQHLTIGP